MFGDRSFAATEPHVWNSLIVHLRNEDIIYRVVQNVLKEILYMIKVSV